MDKATPISYAVAPAPLNTDKNWTGSLSYLE